MMNTSTFSDALNLFLTKQPMISRQKNLATSLFGLTDRPAVYSLRAVAEAADLKLLDRVINRTDPELANDIETLIRDSLMAYTNQIQPAVKIYLSLLDFLERTYGLKVSSEWLNELGKIENREWTIIQMSFQNKSIKEIAEKLFTDEHTIRSDIRHLLQEGFLFIDQRVKIDGMDTERGNLIFQSTPHPVMLMGNLLQMLTLLEALRNYESLTNSQIPRSLALSVWSQLSDYARQTLKQRIQDGIIQSDLQWYTDLDKNRSANRPNFQTEYRMSGDHIPDRLLMVFKGGEPCKLVYRQDDSSEIMLNKTRVIHLNFEDADFAQDYDQRDRLVNVRFDQIISCEPLTVTK
jgi:hypothetical protein